jgi:6-phosphofructokinase 1
MLKKGSRIGILTSGGDAPGMNAALRAAARVGLELGFEVHGVEDGYNGLIEGRVAPLDLRALDEGARRGGTILGTARSAAFRTEEGRAKAKDVIRTVGLSGLVVIGGNGSLTGAHALRGAEGADGPLRIVGIPASIDNDLACTSMAIGVDTAMNTIVEACDRIFDTAIAHRRTFIVEVMGRDCGYLAMTAGVAAGADVILVPEVSKTEDEIVHQILRAMDAVYAPKSAKRRVLVVKAEGVKVDSNRLKSLVDERATARFSDADSRVTVLGHVVRGGSPSAFDRLLASRLAHAAIRAVADGDGDKMAGWIGPGVDGPACSYDPYVALTSLDKVLAETELLVKGVSPLAAWRKRIFRETEGMLAR